MELELTGFDLPRPSTTPSSWSGSGPAAGVSRCNNVIRTSVRSQGTNER